MLWHRVSASSLVVGEGGGEDSTPDSSQGFGMTVRYVGWQCKNLMELSDAGLPTHSSFDLDQHERPHTGEGRHETCPYGGRGGGGVEDGAKPSSREKERNG